LSGAPLRAGFDLRGRRHAYTIVEPRGEFRDGRRVPHNPITWGFRLARHVGCAGVGSLPPMLAVARSGRDAVRARLRDAGLSDAVLEHRRVVGLNPGRPVASKSWRSDRFVELARRLRREGHGVMVFWGPGEEAEAARVAEQSGAVRAPALSLVEMSAALTWCAALVTIDSGLKHLAVCSRTPTVTLFGSTDPREWHMGSEKDAVLWRGLSCSPCRRLECPFGTPCMDLDVDAVMMAVVSVLEEAA
jgi:heptosyltransferase-2